MVGRTDRMDFTGLRYMVVGAGLFGATVAERLASQSNERVVVVDARPYAGGICFSERFNETGVEVHRHGIHVFHTSDEEVWQYINRFTDFNHYRYKVIAMHEGKAYPFPISLVTLQLFLGRGLPDIDSARRFLAGQTAGFSENSRRNFEEVALSRMGRPLYDAFIKGYSKKQWGREPKSLPAELADRIPVRLSYNTDFFTDPWQGLPLQGYSGLFRNLLSHPNIELLLGVDFREIRHLLPEECCVVYTGPIDELFEYKYGRLGWRSLDFAFEAHNVEDYQGIATVNYPDEDVPHTRVHEFQHLHPERRAQHHGTAICREFPRAWRKGAERYYPESTPGNLEIYGRYAAELPSNYYAGGRIGSYQYLNMDQAVRQALDLYATRLCRR
jgi:UDP-galactopyranose mutase